MKVQSNSIAFVDTTDTMKLDIHIASNHPTAQIYDTNQKTYTPDWSTSSLILEPTVYADGIPVTDALDSFRWVEIRGIDPAEHDVTTDSKTLEITNNSLNSNIGIIRYKFYATYNNKPFSNEISFALTTTGRDGTDGYTPQKGVDYFDGIDGKDGTSVTIEGVAYSNTTPVTGQPLDLYSHPTNYTQQTKISGGQSGASYLVDGYLCVYNSDIKRFVCTGKIQGPKGEQGDSSFLFIRYAKDQYGTGMTDIPTAETTYIGFYRTPVNEAPTNPSLINPWTKFIGTSASLVTITPSALYFKSTEGKNGEFTPEDIYLYPRFQNVTYTGWQYSVDGGITWKDASGANGLTITTHNSVANTLKINRASTLYTDTVTSISFRCLSSNNAIYDTVSVVKIYDVVDLKIGGRNLARYTDSENWTGYDTTDISFSNGTRSKRIKAMCNATNTATNTRFGIQQTAKSRLMKLQSGKEYTLSFLIRGNITSLNFVNLMHPGSINQDIGDVDVSALSETNFIRVSKTFPMSIYADTSTGSYLTICYEGPKDPSMWFEIEEVQLEAGQVATDWSPSPEDILDSAANVNVMLSNEAHFFEADSNGVPIATSLVLDVIGYKGSIQTPTTIGTITGLPSAGMTATVINNDTTNTKITIAVTTALTSAIADYGVLTIPITVNGYTINKMFSWSKAKAGATGAKGIAGTNGTDGKTSYLHIAYATSADGKSGFSVSDSVNKTYIGQYTDYTEDDSTDPTKYKWTLIKGDKGDQGVQGPKGNDGQQLYTWVKYADSPTSGMSNDPSGKTYIGLAYNKTTATESSTYSDYMWSLIKGETGAVGPKGNDGQQYYTWIKYADNASGANMSNSPTGKLYIGLAYNKTTSTESNTASDYTWALFKGDDGVGINSTTVDYGVSDSATVKPTTWQQDMPVVAEGKYLWTRTIIDYTDDTIADTVTYTYSKQGTKGDTGSSGTSVTVLKIEYQAGSSATTAPTGTWSNTVVGVSEGMYLWTKTTFSDGNIAYGVTKQGISGTPASLVSITPSASHFKSTTGKDGTFTPEFIYLYPRFQNVTYSNWQYSINGGTTWNSVSGANGLTVSTQNSIPNTLSVSKSSTLYTDSITSITFRCNSSNSAIYDTVSIAKIYDVVDLELGGRNILLDSGTSVTNSLYNIKNYKLSLTPIIGEKYTVTLKGTLGTGKTSFSIYNSGGNVSLGALTRIGTSDLYTLTFTWSNGGRTDLDTALHVYTMTNAVTAESTIQWIKLEKGNKATDWTPAPEDINIKLTSSLAEVKTTTDSIASRVSSTESSLSSLTTRVSTAEQKFTPSAIVSTVRQSADYTNDLGKKVNSTEIISKINQTAESITISANKIGLLGATNIPDLTADKIKGGTLTLGGSSAATQNGQLSVKDSSDAEIIKLNKDGIVVKNTADQDMIAINQYGMAISNGNLMIVDESEINEYGGWSSYSHNQLKTTGMKSMYIARNSTAEYHAEVDAIDGLTMRCLGGLNANPYYLHLGPTDGLDDDGSQIAFYQKLRLTEGTVSNGTTTGSVVADISQDEVVLPKANIILQDTAQKNIQFQNASKELRSCMLYAGANDSTTVMGAWDTTKAKSIFSYSTDNKFYILDSEAVTKTMMQNSVGERGYQKMPSGFIIQWGYQGSALTVSGNYNLTSGNITLPIAFPNSFTGIFCQIIEVDSWNTNNIAAYYNLNAKANGLTGFTWKAANYWNNWGSSILFSWMAIGY